MPEKEWTLWENEEMSLQAAYNPGVPREEGFHLVLVQRGKVPSPWADPDLYGRMSVVAAKACGAMTSAKVADWFNIHCDGNIGAAKGTPVMHIHIFGRYKTGKLWGGPLQLPAGEGPYGYEPIRGEDLQRLRESLVGKL